MNKVILVGNLARDPELRQTPAGVSVARFTIAVNRNYTAKDGQQQTDFISCVAWRQLAEFLCRYFQKGSSIQLCGSIQTRSWDGQDGKRQYATEVVADELHFNGPKRQSQDGFAGADGGFGSSQSGGFNTPAQSQPSFDGGSDDTGFSDIDGSEDDLPF